MSGLLDDLRRAFGDRYAIERELGRGGMAVVYLAQDLKHGRAVALKILRPELTASLGVERFVREIQIASQLSHPHIVPLYDSGGIGGFLYYVMPYIEGESLRDRLHRGRKLGFADALPIVQQVAAALSYAHEQGVIHRDIKPENILFSGGEAMVTDFGIARAISAAGVGLLTTSGLPLGTLGYMSPEQAAGSRTLDGRTDVYSLACVLYEMLVGRAPGRWIKPGSLTTGRVTETTSEERISLDGLPPGVERALVKALAQEVSERFETAEAFTRALSQPYGIAATARRRRRRLVAVSATALLAVVVIATMMLRSGRGPPLDADAIAVAPFVVLAEDLEPWREGLVDILSARLDGAGPLRTVAPSVTIRRWAGRAEPAAAAALGRDVGAGLVVYGTLVAAGRDSVRAQATLYDADAGRVVVELEVRDGVDRVDRLADSLAVRLMRELSRRRSLGVWQLASLGSSSPAALKAFLQGEQHYRTFALDSARFYYEQAIELDSNFGLAHARRAVAMGWSVHNDPEFLPSFLRAGALNHGLARRESLLLAADSIEGAIPSNFGSPAAFTLLDRYFSTLQYAAQEYPSDPQVWYELGEARYHYGSVVGVTVPEMREAFASAVGLDSSFAPAYLHLFELTLLDEGPVPARRVLDGYLSRADSSVYRDGRVALSRLLASEVLDSATRTQLEALDEEGLFQAWYDVKWWTDSAETAVRLVRTWVEARDSASGLGTLALSLAYRGHVQEALSLVGRRQLLLDAQVARLGLLSDDSAEAIFGDWVREDNGQGIHMGLPWWAEREDTTALRYALARWDSLARAAEPARAMLARYLTGVAAAYLSLARHDTSGAIRQFAELRNLPNCLICYQEPLTLARLLVATGRDEEAARVYDRLPFAQDQAPLIDAVAAALERGLVHERLGHREQAVTALTFVVDAWRNADPELQPIVEDARAGLARLAAEPRR